MDASLIDQFLSPWILVLALSILLALILALWGCIFLTMFPNLRLNRVLLAFFCECLLWGFLIFSFAGFVGVLFRIPIPETFFFFSVLAFAILVLFLRSGRTILLRNEGPSEMGTSIAITILILFGSTMWSFNNLQGLALNKDGTPYLIPWIDIFFHARMIGNFAQFQGDPGTLNLAMSGEGLAIYHYGPYMFSALVSSLGRIPSLQIAYSLFPIFGMALTGASMVVIASLIGGSRNALLATILLFYLPDPMQWFTNGVALNSYFFLQQVGIGGSYAVAILGLALAYSLSAFQKRSLWHGLVSLALFVLSAFFKIQIVLAYSLFFVLYVSWNMEWLPRKVRLGFFLLVALSFFLAISWLNNVPDSPTMSLSLVGIYTDIGTAFPFFSEPWGRIFAVPPAAYFIFFSIYGLLFPAVLYFGWKLRQRGESRPIRILLLVTLVGHAIVALLLANNTGYGDPYEVNRKTIVWPYFVIVVCTSALASTHLRQIPITFRYRKAVFISLFLLLLYFSVSLSRNVQIRPQTEWLRNTLIEKGLFSSAIYIKKHSTSGEVVQLCENDPYFQLGVLAERPAYIMHPETHFPRYSALEHERFAVVTNIRDAQSPIVAKTQLARANITWFLMTPRCAGPWEVRAAPVFSADGYRLYRRSSL